MRRPTRLRESTRYGERKTLRMVAQYADACNLFATPDVEHKLEVPGRDRRGTDVWQLTPLDVTGREIIPAVASW